MIEAKNQKEETKSEDRIFILRPRVRVPPMEYKLRREARRGKEAVRV